MPVGDHTSYLDKCIIRTKLSGPMDGSLLQNKEFCYGDTEISLFVKAPTGNEVYQFGRINDVTSGDINSVWSSLFTKNYIQSLQTSKTILLTAAGIAPTVTSGCTEPYVSENNSIPKVFADFDQGEYGFWNISIPGDYTGNISKISVLYSGPPQACQWSVSARVLSDNADLDTGGAWSTIYNLSDTPVASNRMELVELESDIDLFGSASNANNFACIRINLSTGTGTYKLLQVKLEY